MLSRIFRECRTGMLAICAIGIVSAGKADAAVRCPSLLTNGIPQRASAAPSGTELMSQIKQIGGTARDEIVLDQILTGNLPGFLRRLSPVEMNGTLANGKDVRVTICVTPEYLSVGSNRDFVRVPMGLAAAAKIANELGFLLPTPKMVDEIYRQARVRMTPRPMKPTSQMESTAYLVEHNRTLDRQRASDGGKLSYLSAGQKKDIVLTNRLRSKSGRVAIYGWHRSNGKPIQPLSTVHGAAYADYSHGVRLVSRTAFVNGEPQDLADILQDNELASFVSREGPIADPEQLLARQY